jgi:hypothetical protein
LAFPSLLVLVALPAAAAPPLLQSGSPDARVADEVAFAQGLATKLGFIDLATERLGALRREKLSPANEQKVAAATCGVLRLGAQQELDRRRRLEIQTRAVRAYEDYLSRYGGTSGALAARLEYAEIAACRGQFLAEEVQRLDQGGTPTEGVEEAAGGIFQEDPEGEPPAGDLRARLGAAADGTFTIAVREAERVLAAIEGIPAAERSEEEQVARFRAWYAKGKAHYDWALASPLESRRRYESLRTSFEELQGFVLDAAETSWFGLIGYLQLARTSAEMGRGTGSNEREERERREQVETSFSLCDWVVGNALPSDPEGLRRVEENEGEEGKGFRRERTEEAFSIAIALANREADVEAPGRWTRRFLEWLRREDRRAPSTHGQLALLEGARALFEEGNASEALRLAERVIRENPRTTLELRAQTFLAEAIAAGGGGDPGILLEAAEGMLRAGRDSEGIETLHRALGRLRDEADRLEYGGPACLLLGRAFEALDLPYEAAMAYRTGAKDFPDDPETAECIATGFHRAVLAIRRSSEAARSDEAVESLLAEAEGAVTKLSSGAAADRLLWTQAVKLRDEAVALLEEKKVEEARAKFAEAAARLDPIGKGSEWHERALARKGVLAYEAGDLEEAIRLFEACRRFLEEPGDAGSDRARSARREEALAEVDYFAAALGFRRANEGTSSGGRKEAFAKALLPFERYLDRHADRAEYHARVLYCLVVGNLEAGRLEEAKRRFSVLRERFAGERFAGLAAGRLFAALERRLAEAREEARVSRGAGSQAAQAALTAALAENAEVLSLYNETATPAYDPWRREADLWLELADRGAGGWDRPTALFERIARRFAGDEEARADGASLRASLARGYLAQGRLALAEGHLREVLAQRKTKSTQLLLARCLGGTLEGARPPFTELAGTAGADSSGDAPPGAARSSPKFEEADRLWRELVATHPNAWGDCEYFELLFGHLYMLYRWSKVDPVQGNRLRSSLRAFEATAPDLGASACGPEMAARFRWLTDRAR